MTKAFRFAPIVVLSAVIVILHGCGGGGDSPTPAPGPAPAPDPAPAPGPDGPTAAPVPAPPAIQCGSHADPSTNPPTYECAPITVLSYNLKWYAQHGMQGIQEMITSQGPYDIMGLQECENVDSVVSGLDGNWGTLQLYDGPHDIAIAWDKDKYKMVDHGFVTNVGHDAWWTRQLMWVRLQMVGTSDSIFFANVHGAVAACNGTAGKGVSDKYHEAIQTTMKDGEHFFFTGDFNCQTYDDVMQDLANTFNDSAQASWFYPVLYQPDHIFTSKTTLTVNSTGVCCGGPGKNCEFDNGDKHCIAYPSDHELLKGHYLLPLGGAGPVPTAPPTPAPTAPTLSKCADIGCGNHDNTCWCTESCVSHNSCCPDYQDLCKTEHAAALTIV